MYKYVSAQLVSLIYVAILSLVYFLKRKYNFLESKIYKSLLIITIISLVLDVSSMYVLESNLYDGLVVSLFSKMYFMSLLVWLIVFIFYVILNKTTVKYDNFKVLIKKSILCKSWLVVSFILFIFMFFCKVNYNVDPVSYSGDGVVLLYSLGIFPQQSANVISEA